MRRFFMTISYFRYQNSGRGLLLPDPAPGEGFLSRPSDEKRSVGRTGKRGLRPGQAQEPSGCL